MIVIADQLPELVAPGDALALDVHVVNDLRRALEAADCTATLRWPGGSHEWRWQGDVGADSVARVGIVRFVVPDVPGRAVARPDHRARRRDRDEPLRRDGHPALNAPAAQGPKPRQRAQFRFGPCEAVAGHARLRDR